MSKIVGHNKCRPPRGAVPIVSAYDGSTKLWRLCDDGKWREDNKQPGLAFIGMVKDDEPTIWVANCKCHMLNGCTRGAAFKFALDKLDIGTISVHERAPVKPYRLRRK